MKHSETINAIAPALVKAQAAMGSAKKSAENPFFSKKYADLGEIISCVKEPFADNGLSFIQFPIASEDRAGVETILLHESGEWISNEFTMKCAKNDPQGSGSAFTYARRYGLQAAAGIPTEDDDGNDASTTKAPAKSPAKAKAPPAAKAPPSTPAQKAEAYALSKEKLKWFEIINPISEIKKWHKAPLSDIAADGDVESINKIIAFFGKSVGPDTPALTGLMLKLDMALTEAKAHHVPTATDPATGKPVDAPF